MYGSEEIKTVKVVFFNPKKQELSQSFKRRCQYMPISLSAYICVIGNIVFVDTYKPKYQSTHKQFTFNSE